MGQSTAFRVTFGGPKRSSVSGPSMIEPSRKRANPNVWVLIASM